MSQLPTSPFPKLGTTGPGKYIYIYQKPKNSVVWEGRPNFSFLFKSCEIFEIRGDLSSRVENN